jgi:hypothetical protein
MKKRGPQSRSTKKGAACQPPPAPKAERQPPQRLGTVTLWGEILEEDDVTIKMAIKNHGDAIDVGLNGTQWIAKRQIYGKPGRADGYDYVRINFVYASQLAQAGQQCE